MTSFCSLLATWALGLAASSKRSMPRSIVRLKDIFLHRGRSRRREPGLVLSSGNASDIALDDNRHERVKKRIAELELLAAEADGTAENSAEDVSAAFSLLGTARPSVRAKVRQRT